MKIAVLGAGIVGVVCAYRLICDGHDVILVDRRSGPAMETSFANGGLVTPSMSDPWSSPGIPWLMLRMLGRDDAPFLLRPSAIPSMLGWGLDFLANCRKGRWMQNTKAVLRLAMLSRAVLDEIAEAAGIAYDRCDKGSLRIYRDAASLRHDAELAAMYRGMGLEAERLDVEAVVAMEPALHPIKGSLAGGIHYAADQSGDCHAFALALVGTLATMGCTFRFDTPIMGWEAEPKRIRAVRTAGGTIEADAFVLACGSGSATLAGQLGMRLPIYPVKGYSVTLPVGPWNGAPALPIIDHHQKIAVARLGGRLRLAGTAEFAGNDTSPNPRRTALLVNSFRSLFPGYPGPIDGEDWQGLRPMTPDGRPRIGQTRFGNLFVNSGHGALGWTLACGAADVLAAIIAGRPAPVPIEDFAI